MTNLRKWLLLVVLALGVLLPQAALVTVQREQELRVALAARDLARGGAAAEEEGLVPSAVTPPLAPWLVSASHRLLGGWRSEWVTRLPSVAAGVLLLGGIAGLGALLLGRRRAYWAALIAGTSWVFVRFGPMAESEIFAALFSSAAVLLGFAALRGWRFGVSAPATGLCLGLSLLAGGWLPPMLPVLVLLLAPLAMPETSWRRSLALVAVALALGGVVAAPWVLASVRSGGWSLEVLGGSGRIRSLFYYVEKLPLLLLPWGPLIFPSLWVLWRRRGQVRHRFLALWWGVGFALLSALPNKAEQTLLLLLAPSSLILSGYVLCAACSRECWRSGLVWGYLSGWALLLVLSAIGLFLLPLFGLGFPVVGCVVTGSAVLLVALFSVGHAESGLFARRCSSLLAMLAAAYLSYPLIFHEWHRPQVSLVQVSGAVRATLADHGERTVFMAGPGIGVVRYYLDHPVLPVGSLEQASALARPRDILIEVNTGPDLDEAVSAELVPRFRERRPGFSAAYYVFPQRDK